MFRVAVAAAVLLSAAALTPAEEGILAPPSNRYFVHLRNDGGVRRNSAWMHARAGMRVRHDFGNTLAVEMDDAAMNDLRRHHRHRFVSVERDPVRYPLRGPKAETLAAVANATRRLQSQSTPYGIGKVASDVLRNAVAAPLKVCIIDSGYAIAHVDLPSTSVTGVSQIANEDWSAPGDDHGTHVAGTIAALDNSVGVVGVIKSNPSLHIVKIFDDNGQWTFSSDLIDALNSCVANGARVVSMSLGGPSNSATEEQAFQAALDNNVLSIAAAGNDGNSAFSYPASHDSVVSVAATNSNDQRASFSQFNDQVELSAPGVGVESTVGGSALTFSVGGVPYDVNVMVGSPATTATAPLFDCGIADSVCTGASGRFCLISRGDVTFAEKVQNCQNGGGVGAAIYNTASGNFAGTLSGAVTTIPSFSLSGADGTALLSQIGSTASYAFTSGTYASFSGTSMATPHVSAVAALVGGACSSATASEIRSALGSTAMDLGASGRDNEYGFGLVQGDAAAQALCGFSVVCGDGTCDAAGGETQCSCEADCGAPPATEDGLCADGIDNDCDGDTDEDDAECDPCGDGTCDAAGGETQCSCEADCGAPPATEDGLCADGIDNDCDGDTDEDDRDCQACVPRRRERCWNGIDDTCNGLVDFEDPDCCRTYRRRCSSRRLCCDGLTCTPHPTKPWRAPRCL